MAVGCEDGSAHLWEAANILRGSPVDRADWKSYILPLIFFKRTCDVWDEEHAGMLFEYGEDFPDEHRFQVPEGCHWNDVRTAARNDSYFRLDQPARLVSFQPHGHYRLSHMTLEAILPNGQVQVLTDVPRFVWTWQITYPYKYQPAFPKGTVLHSISYHNNSSGNKENPDPTAFVGHGARTVDEMDNGWLDFYYITDEEYANLEKEHSKAILTNNTGAN